ncbi:MAG: hypothetical protein EA427_01110 [Spirochaetaceae bacterium]|nr:MAG: hypothetical protein EA427_01110 [Spirochaetaceae bacterium]
MKVALILNTRRDDSEFHAEYDPVDTVEAIRRGIEEAGHEYLFIEGDEDAYERIRSLGPDLVFNRTEGIRGESRESHIPAMLEMLGIPYVGSGVLTLALCLNKEWTKQLLRGAGIATPASALIGSEADLREPRELQLPFPVILKPNAEGSSVGINEDNVVHDESALREKALSMLKTYPGAILAEEFIPGREISTGVLGTGGVGRGAEGDGMEVLPFLEVDFSRLPAEVENVFGQRAKSTYDDLSHYLCPAPLDATLAESLREISLAACRVLGIRDFARLDFRIGSDGVPRFLEVNPLPGMDYDEETKDFSFFIIMALRSGLTYSALVDRLLRSAWRRAVGPRSAQ